MEPCTKCTQAKTSVKPIISKYPCKIGAEENRERKPSQEIKQEKRKTIDEQKMTIPKKKEPCKGVEIQLQKTLEFLKRNNCLLPFSRAWDKTKSESFKKGLLPNWVKRRGKILDCLECPREWDEYERKLFVRICKEPIRPPPEVIFEPIDQAVCVFCLGDLYTGGYLHDISQKIPYIKQQSQENNDEIIPRIGIRPRITVHKNCYNLYIDRSKQDEELEEEDEESDPSTLCDGTKRKSEEEVIVDLEIVKKPNFCLGRPKLPKLPSDLEEDLLKYRPKVCK